MKRRKFTGGLVALGLLLVLTISGSAADTTVVVTGDTAAGENQPGWLFGRDGNNATPYEFNQDAASIGQGSLYVEPIVGDAAHKFIGEYFINVPIADVDSITYDFLIGNGGDSTDANEFYMNVYANFGESDDFKFFDCRYDIIPTVGSTSDFTTVEFDPTSSYPVAESGSSPHTCPSVPAEMNVASEGSTIRMFSLNVGDTSANDNGLDGYLDNVVVSLTSGTTTFDFEPALTPETKDECKNGGWQNFNTPEFKNQGDCVSFVVSNQGGN